MNMRAWPFLVSRNRNVDYTTVVAPQFMVNQGITNLLADAAGGKVDEANRGKYREIRGSKVGDLTLVFHVIQAEKRHVGLEGDEPLRDQSGRPIRLIEGIVLRGLMPGIEVSNSDIQVAHEMVKGAYKEFWNSTSSIFTEKSSQSFYLQTDNQVGEHLKLQIEQPFAISQREKELLPPGKSDSNKPPRRGLIITLGITGIAVASGAGAFVYYFITQPPSPSSVLDSFCTALTKPNYPQAYALLSDRVQGQYSNSEQTFAGSFIKPITSCTPKVTSQSGNKATATLTYQYQGREREINLNLIFVTDKNSWKIDSNSFP